MEVKVQRTEVRCLKSDDGGRRTENKKLRAEDGYMEFRVG